MKFLYRIFLLLMLAFALPAKAQPGSSFSNPIDAGSIPHGSWYWNLEPNAPFVWYSFTIYDYSTVSINTCNSSADNRLILFDANETLIDLNEDYGPLCPGMQASIQINLAPGVYYVLTEKVIYAAPGYLEISINAEGNPDTGSGEPPAGANLYNAIDAGRLGKCLGGYFSDTQSNIPINNFGNELGQPSDDIFYTFSLASEAKVDISTSDSDINTYFHLYNLYTGELIDTYGPYFPGSGQSAEVTLPMGAYYVAAEGAGTSGGDINTTIRIVPGQGLVPEGGSRQYPVNAGTLPMGGSFNNTFDPSDCYEITNTGASRNYCKFSLLSNAAVSVSAEGALQVSLLDTAGFVIKSQSSEGLNTVLLPGTYYLAAEGSMDGYFDPSQGYVRTPVSIVISVSAATAGTAQGANLLNAIDAGTYTRPGSFNDTKNNSNNAFGNDIGQLSNDIYYKFTLKGTASVTLSHCGSGFDTYLHLLNSTGGQIKVNDDNAGSACPGLQAYLQTELPAGIYYLVSEGFSESTGNIKTTLNITSIAALANVSGIDIDGTWNLEKDVEKSYRNGVIQRDTTSNYTFGANKIVLNQGNYTLYRDNAAVDTGIYSCINNYIVLNNDNGVVNFRIKKLDLSSGILIMLKENSFTDPNAVTYSDILESHFISP